MGFSFKTAITEYKKHIKTDIKKNIKKNKKIEMIYLLNLIMILLVGRERRRNGWSNKHE